MDVFLRKLKKSKLSLRLVYYFVAITAIVSYILLFRNVLLLKVETLIRVVALVVLGIINILYIVNGLILLFTKKHKSLYFLSIIIIIISAASLVGALYISKTYGMLSSLKKENIIYTTDLVLLKDTEFTNNKDFKVGIIKDTNDVDNIIAQEIIKDNKLNVTLVEYETTFELLEKLYSKELNGIFITDNYILNYQGYDSYNNISTETKIQYTKNKEMKNQTTKKSTGSVTRPFTILLMGVDSEDDTLNKNTAFNGDTLMILAFNPKTLNATVFSIPRDTYAPIINNYGKQIGYGKINSSAAYGPNAPIYTVENFLGLTMDYTVKINFRGVIDLVNKLGGIDITVPEGINFCESNEHRSLKQEDLICIKSGYQHMNGEQALAFARHRKTLLTGDFQRVQHQQLVVEAIANSAKNLSSIDDFMKVFDSISRNVETNMGTNDMFDLYGTFKKMISNTTNGSLINIEKTYLSGYDLYLYVENLRTKVYTFQYYEDSLKDIVDALKVTLEMKDPEMVKTFTFSANKNYEQSIIGKGFYNQKRIEVLPDFTGSSLEYTKSWCRERNITVSVNYIDTSDHANDTVISQNSHAGINTSGLTSLTVNVAKNIPVENNDTN